MLREKTRLIDKKGLTPGRQFGILIERLLSGALNAMRMTEKTSASEKKCLTSKTKRGNI